MKQIWNLRLSTNQIYKRKDWCDHQSTRNERSKTKEKNEMEKMRTRISYLTSDQISKEDKTDLDNGRDRFIGDLPWLGSSMQWTKNGEDRETPTKKRRERSAKRTWEREETLTARIFRSLWNSTVLRYGFWIEENRWGTPLFIGNKE